MSLAVRECCIKKSESNLTQRMSKRSAGKAVMTDEHLHLPVRM